MKQAYSTAGSDPEQDERFRAGVVAIIKLLSQPLMPLAMRPDRVLRKAQVMADRA